MEEKVLEIFKVVFSKVEPDEITLDAEFREWEQFSSLTLSELLARLEETLGVKLKLSALVNAETIEDVVDAVNESM
jgi:acyl carrier protein